jgi:hypothetical protein
MLDATNGIASFSETATQFAAFCLPVGHMAWDGVLPALQEQ